ncbi:MAG: hypothetical protein LAT82_00845 [Nanoarchaeota archaeon]|nr:hypothetical protein [Nanoarchaeota archaeon]
MKEVSKVENKLLDRVEYVFEIQSSSTPSREELKTQIVKQLKADEKLVSIQEIKSHYGSQTIHIIVYVYESQDVMESLVPKHIAKRNNPAVEGEE